MVFVHGAWHIPQHYQEVMDQKERGFTDVHCPRLPSATELLPPPSTANLERDTISIKGAIKALIEDGRDVIVLMDSYEGVVGSNALDSLLATQRKVLACQRECYTLCTWRHLYSQLALDWLIHSNGRCRRG